MGLRIGDVALGGRPAIVASGGERETDALAAATGAGLVELRADRFEQPTPERILAAIMRVRAGRRPVIVTARHRDEGGTPMPEDVRRAILLSAIPHVAAVDVEIASTELLSAIAPALTASAGTLILSAHDFRTTPPADALQAIIDRGRALGAHVVKIATRTDTPAALETLLGVTLANRAAGIVTLGMGAYGPLSRVALPAAGSLLTYAAVGEPTAPGQLPLDALAPIVDRLYEGT